MHRDSERQKLFSRRAAMLIGGKALLLSALVGRMYYLQVVESDRYRTLAEENRINLRLLPPPRGRIVDRFGVPMADNQQNYRVLLNARETEDVEKTLDILGRIVSIGPGERQRILRELRRSRSFVPATVRENLNWQEVARIEVNAPDLPGVLIDVGQSRHYPHGVDAAPVLGYVAAVSPNEVSGDPLLELPGFRVGKAGVEKIHDHQLRGIGGSSQVEVNAFGRVIRELSRQEGQPGADITLTVDLELQRMVSRRLAQESAAAVVIDIANGDVLAMASTPSFDPNAFNKGLSADEWRALSGDPKAPLINKAIGGNFPPGSTFKPMVLLAALERGAIAPETRVFCKGELEFGDAVFHCWKKGGHGWVDAHRALTESCDTYFYETARRAGIDRIAAMANRFGFGHTLGLDLPGERPGLVPTRKWKRKVMDAPWHPGETLVIGIGQGYLLATPLQLAVMMARLVNGGFAVTPRLTRPKPAAGEPPHAPEFDSLELPPAHLDLITDALVAAVNDRHGTAYRARIKRKGFEMGGKTGTVQVRRISKAERESGVRKNKQLRWEERDHALFVGFAPTVAPRYAVAVVVEHGGGGASVAAPIARDILLDAQRRVSARPGILPAEVPVSGQQQAEDDGRPGGGKG